MIEVLNLKELGRIGAGPSVGGRGRVFVMRGEFSVRKPRMGRARADIGCSGRFDWRGEIYGLG
jgi:hypothetical protein